MRSSEGEKGMTALIKPERIVKRNFFAQNPAEAGTLEYAGNAKPGDRCRFVRVGREGIIFPTSFQRCP